MKSIKRVLNKYKEKNPGWSDYLGFAETVKGRNFTNRTINEQFDELVSKNDYTKKEKRELLASLYALTQWTIKLPLTLEERGHGVCWERRYWKKKYLDAEM